MVNQSEEKLQKNENKQPRSRTCLPFVKDRAQSWHPTLSDTSKHHLVLFLYANSILFFFRPDTERKVRETNNKYLFFFLSRLRGS